MSRQISWQGWLLHLNLIKTRILVSWTFPPPPDLTIWNSLRLTTIYRVPRITGPVHPLNSLWGSVWAMPKHRCQRGGGN